LFVGLDDDPPRNAQLLGQRPRRRKDGLGLQPTASDRAAKLLFQLVMEWQPVIATQVDEQFARRTGPGSAHRTGPYQMTSPASG
jgi:hypothetical protein